MMDTQTTISPPNSWTSSSSDAAPARSPSLPAVRVPRRAAPLETSAAQYQDPDLTKDEHIMQVLFKTTQCNFFKKGKCRKGARCSFAHGESDTRNRPDLTKTTICRSWQTRRRCRMGDSCKFAHGTTDQRNRDELFETFRCMSSDAPSDAPSASQFSTTMSNTTAEPSEMGEMEDLFDDLFEDSHFQPTAIRMQNGGLESFSPQRCHRSPPSSNGSMPAPTSNGSMESFKLHLLHGTPPSSISSSMSASTCSMSPPTSLHSYPFNLQTFQQQQQPMMCAPVSRDGGNFEVRQRVLPPCSIHPRRNPPTGSQLEVPQVPQVARPFMPNTPHRSAATTIEKCVAASAANAANGQPLLKSTNEVSQMVPMMAYVNIQMAQPMTCGTIEIPVPQMAQRMTNGNINVPQMAQPMTNNNIEMAQPMTNGNIEAAQMAQPLRALEPRSAVEIPAESHSQAFLLETLFGMDKEQAKQLTAGLAAKDDHFMRTFQTLLEKAAPDRYED